MVQSRLLLVEDSTADVESVTRAVRRLNASVIVEVAENAGAAITALSAGPSDLPGLVLLDLKLGPSSGLDVLRWARSRSELASIPFVVFTSSNDPRDVAECYAAGADSFLHKPVSFALFQSALGSVLDYWAERSEVPAAGGSAMRNVVTPDGPSAIHT